MSRVHDALRRAEQAGMLSPPANRVTTDARATATPAVEPIPNLSGLLEQAEVIPFRTPTDSLLLDVSRPHEAPMEEFRTLRTRLHQMKTFQPVHTALVPTSSLSD